MEKHLGTVFVEIRACLAVASLQQADAETADVNDSLARLKACRITSITKTD